MSESEHEDGPARLRTFKAVEQLRAALEDIEGVKIDPNNPREKPWRVLKELHRFLDTINAPAVGISSMLQLLAVLQEINEGKRSSEFFRASITRPSAEKPLSESMFKELISRLVDFYSHRGPGVNEEDASKQIARELRKRGVRVGWVKVRDWHNNRRNDKRREEYEREFPAIDSESRAAAVFATLIDMLPSMSPGLLKEHSLTRAGRTTKR